MPKKILSAVLLLAILTSALLCFAGCDEKPSAETAANQGHYVFILNEQGYTAFSGNSAGGDGATASTETIVPVENMMIGQDYYIVAYSHVESGDQNNPMFISDGSISITTEAEGNAVPADDAMEVFEVSTAGNANVDYNESSAENGGIKYFVRPTAGGTSATFCLVMRVQMKEEVEVKVTYHMGARTTKKGAYVEQDVGAKALSLTPKQVELHDFKVAYLQNDQYVDGRFDEANLTDSLGALKAGEKYYMVISAKVTPKFEEVSSELVTFHIKLSPSQTLDGTLEVASSGEFQENSTAGMKEISVSFKLPESGTKDVQFIIKLAPVAPGEADIYLDFSADMLQIIENWGDVERDVALTIGE